MAARRATAGMDARTAAIDAASPGNNFGNNGHQCRRNIVGMAALPATAGMDARTALGMAARRATTGLAARTAALDPASPGINFGNGDLHFQGW